MDGGYCVLSAFAASMSVHLLQASNTSVDQIAAEVGYANGVTLRTLVRHKIGRGVRGLRARNRSKSGETTLTF